MIQAVKRKFRSVIEIQSELRIQVSRQYALNDGQSSHYHLAGIFSLVVGMKERYICKDGCKQINFELFVTIIHPLTFESYSRRSGN